METLTNYVIQPLVYGLWFTGVQLSVMFFAILVWVTLIAVLLWSATFNYTADVFELSYVKQDAIKELQGPTVKEPVYCQSIMRGGP